MSRQRLPDPTPSDHLHGYLDYLEGGPLAVTIPPRYVLDPTAYQEGARQAEAEVGALEAYSPSALEEWEMVAQPGRSGFHGKRHRPAKGDQEMDPDDGWDQEEEVWL